MRYSFDALISPIIAQNSPIRSAAEADTIAFIINYENDGGFAIIANDDRIESLLAYSESGHLSADNPLVKALFLDKIENFINKSVSQNETVSNNTATTSTQRIVIEPRIDLEIGSTAPFNQLVDKYYPGCHAGIINVATATILSHTLKSLKYRGYEYNFDSINYALKQGYGWEPAIPIAESFDIIKPELYATFLYSYSGSIAAYNQLLFDIGKDTDTRYITYPDSYPSQGSTLSSYSKVTPLYTNLGLDVTEISEDVSSIDNYFSLLNNEYFVQIFGHNYSANGKEIDIPLLQGDISYIIDGCDLLVDNENKPVSGFVHCVWGGFKLGDGFFHFQYFCQMILITCSHLHS